MRIGIDASRANLEERTGTEWYAFEVIEQLKSIIPTEHTVFLYTKEPLRADMLPFPENWENVVLKWPPRFLWTQLRLSWEMLVRCPDILYVPAHTIPVIHPKKLVTVIHDVGFASRPELYNHTLIGPKSRLVRLLMNAAVRVITLGKYGSTEYDYHRFSAELALKRARKVITISAFSQQELARHYNAHGQDIIPIFNGRREQHVEPAPFTDVATQYGITGEYLLTIGRVEEKKNSMRLVQAFHTLVQHGYTGQLVFAGRPGYGADAITQYIVENGLQDRVILTDWITDAALYTLLQQTQLFVFPALYEGFGMPVIEALAEGVPVVCSDLPPLREVGGTLPKFADPLSADALAHVIEEALADTEWQDHTRTDGPEYVKRFSWYTTAEQTWNVMKNL